MAAWFLTSWCSLHCDWINFALSQDWEDPRLWSQVRKSQNRLCEEIAHTVPCCAHIRGGEHEKTCPHRLFQQHYGSCRWGTVGHGNAAHGVTRKSPVCFGFSAVSKGQHGSAVALVSAHQSLASGDGWELHPSMPHANWTCLFHLFARLFPVSGCKD